MKELKERLAEEQAKARRKLRTTWRMQAMSVLSLKVSQAERKLVKSWSDQRSSARHSEP